MKTIGIYEAKTHLSQVCEEAVRTGEPCLISKNGRPLVKLVPYRSEELSDSVWNTVEESSAKYGPLEDFELPERQQRDDLSEGCLDQD